MDYSLENDKSRKLTQSKMSIKDRIKKKLTKHNITKITKIIWVICRFFLMFGLGFVILYPLLQTISKTFMPVNQYTDLSVIWIPKSFTMRNIYNAIDYIKYWTSLKDTVILSITCAILQIMTAAITGYGFARFRFKFREPLFLIVILSIIIPSQIIFLPNFVQYRFFDFFGLGRLVGYTKNLINDRLTFWIPSALGVGIRSGLFIYIFRQTFRNIPKELEEAAKIDGCGSWITFIKIMVPNAKAAIVTVFLFSVVWHWNEFTLARTFFPKAHQPLAVALAMGVETATTNLATKNDLIFQMSLSYASALIFLIPPMILYVFTQRLFVEGVESSGIKG